MIDLHLTIPNFDPHSHPVLPELHWNSVVFGVAQPIYKHAGNVWLRCLAKANCHLYVKENKHPLAEAIVDYIVRTGGQFLVAHGDSGWTPVHDHDKKRCIKKVQTLLKDYRREQLEDEMVDRQFELPIYGLEPSF